MMQIFNKFETFRENCDRVGRIEIEIEFIHLRRYSHLQELEIYRHRYRSIVILEIINSHGTFCAVGEQVKLQTR